MSDVPWVVFREALEKPSQYISKFGKTLKPKRDRFGLHEFSSQRATDDLWPLVDKASRKLGVQVDGRFEPFKMIKIQSSAMSSGLPAEWRCDNPLAPGMETKLTVVCELSNGYRGGGIDFLWPVPGQGIKHVDLKPGDVLVFPSVLIYREAEVARGVRWSLIGRALGRRFR